MMSHTEQEWLQTPLGQYLLEQEQAFFDAAVGDLFGFNALQMGMTDINLLRQSRIPFCFKAGEKGVPTILCEAAQMPFAANSIDLLLLPHVLEFSRNPHETLREAERILLPEGHVVITGFNPVSLWGMRRLLGKQHGYPWQGKFISLLRLKDWLALLGFEVVAGRMACYAPPLPNPTWLNRFRFLDRAGDRWWPMLGGVYFLVAKKSVLGMRLIRPSWNGARVTRALMPRPTRKTEYQREKHGKSG